MTDNFQVQHREDACHSNHHTEFSQSLLLVLELAHLYTCRLLKTPLTSPVFLQETVSTDTLAPVSSFIETRWPFISIWTAMGQLGVCVTVRTALSKDISTTFSIGASSTQFVLYLLGRLLLPPAWLGDECPRMIHFSQVVAFLFAVIANEVHEAQARSKLLSSGQANSK